MRYTTDTMRVVNKQTGKSTYYKMVCEVWRRISKEDDKKLWSDSYSASNMFSVDKDDRYTRHYTTLNYDFDLNIDN